MHSRQQSSHNRNQLHRKHTHTVTCLDRFQGKISKWPVVRYDTCIYVVDSHMLFCSLSLSLPSIRLVCFILAQTLNNRMCMRVSTLRLLHSVFHHEDFRLLFRSCVDPNAQADHGSSLPARLDNLLYHQKRRVQVYDHHIYQVRRIMCQ
jgi:hypothetical protein